MFSIETYCIGTHDSMFQGEKENNTSSANSCKYCVVDSVFSAIETTCLELLGVLALGIAFEQCFHNSLIAQNE